ncbi:MAG: Fic family protein [Gemmatimonadota bacterium]|nr:Fic family protein [Gemmatimonadota bacterium]
MVSAFRGRDLPEPARPVGYAELIERFDLRVPLPHRLAGIAGRHHPEPTPEWLLLTPRHAPADTLGAQLEFALKWEGVDLAMLSALFKAVPADEIAAIVAEKPKGIYARRIWFLWEWLTGRELDVPDPGKIKAVPVLDARQQFARQNGELSSRHKVIDNLPGTREFCPLVRRTPRLERFAAMSLDLRAREVISRTHPDIVTRAAAFLLLSDSRSSFQIEGEQPSPERAMRWGRAIAQAGTRSLSIEELERLQAEVIGDARFVHLGLRTEGGFVGVHDRVTGQPIPDHISARADDLPSLVRGVVEYDSRAVAGEMDPVVAAAAIAFGFVYIHPFEDGNGRIHRWLIHHVLARAGYSPPGVIFPVSAAILREITLYREVLESYSEPLLRYIEWRPTDRGNLEVLNDTADYYRYFDATGHAEFLYHCVQATVERDLPAEVAYLEAYDQFIGGVQEIVDMPARTADLLHRFLAQGNGRLSKRARSREFTALTDVEVERVEELYRKLGGVAGEEPERRYERGD